MEPVDFNESLQLLVDEDLLDSQFIPESAPLNVNFIEKNQIEMIEGVSRGIPLPLQGHFEKKNG